MHTVAQQLKEISAIVQRAASERALLEYNERLLHEQRSAARARAWKTRKDGGKYGSTGLVAAVLARLPSGRENGIFFWQVEALVADVPHAKTGLSSVLTTLAQQDLIRRTGARRQYRYFKPQ